jgi:hypothetical protein
MSTLKNERYSEAKKEDILKRELLKHRDYEEKKARAEKMKLQHARAKIYWTREKFRADRLKQTAKRYPARNNDLFHGDWHGGQQKVKNVMDDVFNEWKTQPETYGQKKKYQFL